MILGGLGLLAALGLLHSVLVASLNGIAWFAILLVLFAAWLRIHANRQRNREEIRLIYEEAPEVDVHALNLLK